METMGTCKMYNLDL